MSIEHKYRFLRQNRILNKKDFGAVFSKGYRVSTRYWTVISRQNQENHPRLGIVIGKKAVKNAVARNRIKRIMRESFRLNQNHLQSVDIVLIAKSMINALDRQALRAVLDKQWKYYEKV